MISWKKCRKKGEKSFDVVLLMTDSTEGRTD